MADTIVSTATNGATTAALTVSATPAKLAASRARKVRENPENEAVVNCMRSWNQTFKKEVADIDEHESDYPARKAADEAYLRDTPPLSGLKNICDFIDCINFASMTGIVTRREAAHYMANVRVALAALSLLPKPQARGAKSAGKPVAISPDDAGDSDGQNVRE